MLKNALIFMGIFIFSFTAISLSFTQSPETAVTGSPETIVTESAETVITGKVEEIAEDGSFIIIDGQKIITTQEFLESSYLEVGDNVEIITQNTDQGLQATSYRYIFEEEPQGVEVKPETTPVETVPQVSEEATPVESAPQVSEEATPVESAPQAP